MRSARFFENQHYSMNKTLHKKLTDKQIYGHTQTVAYPRGEEMLAGLAHEMHLLRDAAKDLMQPRSEAIAQILKLARTM